MSNGTRGWTTTHRQPQHRFQASSLYHTSFVFSPLDIQDFTTGHDCQDYVHYNLCYVPVSSRPCSLNERTHLFLSPMYICIVFNYYQHPIPARYEQTKKRKGRRREDRRPLNEVLYISARIFIGVEMTREGCGDIQCASSVFTRGRSRAYVVGEGREVEDARKSARNLPGNSVPKIAPSIL